AAPRAVRPRRPDGGPVPRDARRPGRAPPRARAGQPARARSLSSRARAAGPGHRRRRAGPGRMSPLLLLPILAFAFTVAAMPAATWMARRFAWVDDPGPLKVHARPVPDTGGLAIVLACILSIALTTEARPTVVAVVAAAAAMATIGFFDDRRR